MQVDDFDEIDSRVAQFQTDPYVKASLDKGLTLHDISKMVDEELAQVEKSIIQDCKSIVKTDFNSEQTDFLESSNVLVLNDLMVSLDLINST